MSFILDKNETRFTSWRQYFVPLQSFSVQISFRVKYKKSIQIGFLLLQAPPRRDLEIEDEKIFIRPKVNFKEDVFSFSSIH